MFSFNFIFSQNVKEKTPEAKTKIEEFSAQTGIVIINGFSKIGSERGEYGSTVTVTCREITNASNSTKQYGITLETMADTKDNTHSSYIDYDEIESLILGIDYLVKIKNDITKLESFQADYKTKDDLEISVFSYNNKISVAVKSGSIRRVTAYFKIDSLPKIKELIVKAKEKIDEIKK